MRIIGTTRVVVLSIVILSETANASDFSIDVDTQPLGACLMGYVIPPGKMQLETFFDTATGFRTRLNVFFLSLELDYKHFLERNFDWIQAGIGYEYKLPAEAKGRFEYAQYFIRGQVAMLILGAEVFKNGESDGYYTESGLRLGGNMGVEFSVGQWFSLGIQWDLGVHYIYTTGTIGFNLSLLSTAGVRL